MHARRILDLARGLLWCGLIAVACPVSPTLHAEPVATSSSGQATLAAAARNNQYTFILFWREEDAATQAMRQTLRAALGRPAGLAAGVEVRVTDPAEKAVVEQFAVSRAPMPLVLAVAPNGAVTGGFPLKLTEEQFRQAFVSPAVAQSLKALQARRLVLLCVQPGPGMALPQGVRDFQADPQYRAASEVVTVQVDDAAEADFLKRLQVSPQTATPVTALLAPPGTLLGTFNGAVTKEQLIDKLKSARSGCCPGGCCPGGCCGAKGGTVKRAEGQP
jgi:hypothetical protein